MLKKTKREKPAWQVEKEARRKEAVAAQLAFDAAWVRNPRAAAEIVYNEVFAEALAEEAARCHERYLWRVEWYKRTITSELGQVEKFRESLAGVDPINEFRWAEKAINAAAKAHVAAALLAVLEAHGPDAADHYAIERALEGARSTSRSSSAMSNVTSDAVTAAFAEHTSTYHRY